MGAAGWRSLNGGCVSRLGTQTSQRTGRMDEAGRSQWSRGCVLTLRLARRVADAESVGTLTEEEALLMPAAAWEEGPAEREEAGGGFICGEGRERRGGRVTRVRISLSPRGMETRLWRVYTYSGRGS